jgi:hypothetical protein
LIFCPGRFPTAVKMLELRNDFGRLQVRFDSPALGDVLQVSPGKRCKVHIRKLTAISPPCFTPGHLRLSQEQKGRASSTRWCHIRGAPAVSGRTRLQTSRIAHFSRARCASSHHEDKHAFRARQHRDKLSGRASGAVPLLWDCRQARPRRVSFEERRTGTYRTLQKD